MKAEQKDKIPNPGSDRAVEMGCTCPVLDNARGKGYMGTGVFWYNVNCPLHSTKTQEKNLQK